MSKISILAIKVPLQHTFLQCQISRILAKNRMMDKNHQIWFKNNCRSRVPGSTEFWVFSCGSKVSNICVEMPTSRNCRSSSVNSSASIAAWKIGLAPEPANSLLPINYKNTIVRLLIRASTWYLHYIRYSKIILLESLVIASMCINSSRIHCLDPSLKSFGS